MEYEHEESNERSVTPLPANKKTRRSPTRSNGKQNSAATGSSPVRSESNVIVIDDSDDIGNSSTRSTNGTSPTKGKSPERRKSNIMSPAAKKRKLETNMSEMQTNLEKLKKDVVRQRAKVKELEIPKFPVKDELLHTIDLRGIPLLPLPTMSEKFPVPKECMTDVLAVWNFLTLFSKNISLVRMTINDFMDVLTYTHGPSVALSEICCSLMRVLLADSSTSNKLSSYIPKRFNFAYQPKSLRLQGVDDIIIDVTVDNQDYDIATNSLRLLPSRLHVQLLNATRWQPILRATLMRLDTVQRLRKAVAQMEFAQISLGQSQQRRLSRRLSLNHVIGSESGTDIVDNGKNQSIKDKDAILNVSSDALKQLLLIQSAASELDIKEMHELSVIHKLAILHVLCDACLDTETMRKVLDKNELDRQTKIAAINKEIREGKLNMKEETAAKRLAAIAQCKKENIAAAKLAAKSPKKGKAKVKSAKSLEPTPPQIQAKLDDMIMMEACGIDEVVPSVEVELPDDDDSGGGGGDSDDEDKSSRRRSKQRLSSVEKQKLRVESQQKLKNIEIANEAMNIALETHSDRDVKNAIRLALKAGMRWEIRGKVTVTQLLKQVYKLQYDLELQDKEERLQSSLEKALVEYPVRAVPIGTDRYKREYYCFDEDLRIFVRQQILITDKDMDMDTSDDNDDKKIGIDETIRRKLLSKCDEGIATIYQSRPSRYVDIWGYYTSQQGLWDLVQSLDERGEREKVLKKAIIAKYDLKEPEVVYCTEGSKYIGRKVRRTFKNKRVVFGTIVGWVPQQGEDVALWHILHEDGDEEDLEEHEILKYLVSDLTSTPSQATIHSAMTTVADTSPTSDDGFNTSDAEAEAEFDDNSNNNQMQEDDSGNHEFEPYIIRYYTNNACRHQQSFKPSQVGVEGMRQELLRIHTMVCDGLKTKGSQAYSRESKKNWEYLVRGAEDLDALKSAVVQLEYTLHSTQSIEDKKEEEEILKEKAALHAELVEEGWAFTTDDSEYIGRRARRFFPGYGKSDCTVTAFLAAHHNDGVCLWRLEHDDGDEEDVDEGDLISALRHLDQDLKEDDNVLGDDDDDSDDDESESHSDDEASEMGSIIEANKNNATLWPTSGVRSRWLAAIERAHTIGEVSLALSSLLDYAQSFGVVGEDPLGVQSKNLWGMMSPSRKNNKGHMEHFYGDYKRPAREAAKKIKSYAED